MLPPLPPARAGRAPPALLASAVLNTRNPHYRRIAAADSIDADGHLVPDVYEHTATAAGAPEADAAGSSGMTRTGRHEP